MQIRVKRCRNRRVVNHPIFQGQHVSRVSARNIRQVHERAFELLDKWKNCDRLRLLLLVSLCIVLFVCLFAFLFECLCVCALARPCLGAGKHEADSILTEHSTTMPPVPPDKASSTRRTSSAQRIKAFPPSWRQGICVVGTSWLSGFVAALEAVLSALGCVA